MDESQISRKSSQSGDGWLRRVALVSAIVIFATGCDSTLTGSDDTDLAGMTTEAQVIARHLSIDPTSPLNYADHAYPTHYTPQVQGNDNAPSDNGVTDQGAQLGRVLFYDTQLSLNGTVSCASCHVQALGFTDDLTLSVGFDGGLTGAHSMRLANANFYEGDEMFWDRRAESLEDQVIQPILDATEMGFSEAAGGISALLTRIETQEYYPILFRRAFGTPEVTADRVQLALAQFVRSMVSTGSRFDDALAAAGGVGGGPGGVRNLPGLTAEENQGFRLFTLPPNAGGAGCAGCHELPTLALDPNSRSNGLDAGETMIFKSPSLKNVAVAGPYMHDGRFATLLEVVEHYNSGVQRGPALDRRLTAGPGGNTIQLGLSDAEKLALVAFMRTLTDTELLEDERFSTPFVGR